MSVSADPDRRKHPRHLVARLCKIRDRRTAMYSAGKTADVSAGGALIAVERERPLGPGDELDIVVAWGESIVLSVESMLRCVVRRVTPTSGGRQLVAIEFTQSAEQVAQQARSIAA